MNKNSFSIGQIKQTGLTTELASEQLRKSGPNKLVGKKPPTNLYFIFKQLQNPLVLVLIVAAVITTIMSEYSDSFVILLAVIVNTTLGFIQERKAFKSLTALKKVVNHETWIIRDGQKIRIEISEVVPGDTIVLYEGDKIPADGIVVESNDLMIDESLLTGESLSVTKKVLKEKIDAETLENFIEQLTQKEEIKAINKLYMGATVVGGSGKIIVTETGMKTEVGKIATHLGDNRKVKTPLEKKLDHLARIITIGVILLSGVIFLQGIILNKDVVEMFTIAVALAVAAIPEGLVVGLTAILAIGMNRILKRKGLVKSLVAAETLGSVTTVCVDKTGTLTEGKMKVVETKLVDECLAYKASTLANDLKDPIELARWQWALEQKQTPPELLIEQNPRDEKEQGDGEVAKAKVVRHRKAEQSSQGLNQRVTNAY